MKYLLLLFTLFSSLAFGQSQNYLINGGFDLWQRGSANAKLTSPVDTKGYLADRWFVTNTTNVSYDRISSNLPTGQKYGAAIALTGASAWLCQRIESQDTLQLSGKKMTISGYERSGTGTDAFKLEIKRPNTVDDYGAQGKNGTTTTTELSATNLLATTSTTLTPWRYTFTVSANMASYGFQVCLGTNSTVTTTYQISSVILNEGMKKLPFRRNGNSISQEITIAQRYYEKSYELSVDPGTGSQHSAYMNYNVGGNNFRMPVTFKTQKRIVATPTGFHCQNANSINTLGPENSGDSYSLGRTFVTTHSFLAWADIPAGFNYFHWMADAEL